MKTLRCLSIVAAIVILLPACKTPSVRTTGRTATEFDTSDTTRPYRQAGTEAAKPHHHPY